MNRLIQTCKYHRLGEHNLHWARADERRPFMPEGTLPQFVPELPVVGRHMRLALHIDFAARRIAGTTTHTLEVRAETVRQVTLQAVGLEIDSVTLGRRRLSFDNTGRTLVVTLPKAVARGERIVLDIRHGVTNPAAGFYFTLPDAAYPDRFRTAWSQGQDEDSRYYFPCLDTPSAKQTSEALLSVPRGCFALSNGELVKHTPGATRDTDLWHYRMDIPYATYLFSIVAGDFTGAHKRQGKVDVRWFAQRGREAEARNAFGNTGRILQTLADFTGVPYPHAQYTQIAVPDFIFGGMENFTVTTQTDLTLHDDRAHLDFSSDDLVAHEAAHTWFGNLVTARAWAHAWLHESFATYMEAIWLRAEHGEAEYQYRCWEDAQAYFAEDANYRRPLVTNRYEEPIDLFDAHLYPGGAVRLRHLHDLLGEQPFRDVLRDYLSAHREGVAETVDLARSVERVTGVNRDWWFDQWIHGAGYPALTVEATWEDEPGQLVLTITQSEPLERGDTASDNQPRPRRWFRLPLRLALLSGTTWQEQTIEVTGEVTRLLLALPRRPKAVVLDPHHACPPKAVTLKLPQDMLLTQLRQAPGAVARIEAARALQEQPGSQVVQALGRQLQRDEFWGVQRQIAKALAAIGGAAARDALLRGLRLDHPKARRGVVEALGGFRDDAKVARALLRLLREGDPSYYVEAEAARSLGKCRAADALPLLTDCLQRPSHLEVIRTAAFDALGELGDPAALELVAEGVAYGQPPLSRAGAMRALARLGRRDVDVRRRALERLTPVLHQRDNPAATFRGKLAALRALGQMGDADALPLLAQVAGQEADGRIVRLAKETMTLLREGSPPSRAMDRMQDDIDAVRKENKGLRDRLERLEQSPPKPRGTGRATKAKPPGGKGKT